MKRMMLAGLAVLGGAVVAVAGNLGEGCTCVNQCPLAKQANVRRTVGHEATGASAAVRADLAALVAKNLGKI